MEEFLARVLARVTAGTDPEPVSAPQDRPVTAIIASAVCALGHHGAIKQAPAGAQG